MTATTIKKPTLLQIKNYASQLPDIYKTILRFLSESDPDRTRGDLFSLGVLRSQKTMHDSFTDRELTTCLMELEEAGFSILDERVNSIELTETGEGLLEAVTGRKSKEVSVPKLPKPKW